MNMEIYQPEEDSYLLAKYVAKHVKRSHKVLDIGCGSGIQSETALKKTKDVQGVDINPDAVGHCKSSEYTKGARFYKSNLFSKVKGKFDVIIFNPPYLPDEKDPEDIKAYTTGGKHGYEIIDSFLAKANIFLAEDGIMLIVFSSKTKKLKVDEIIANYLFESELLEEKPIFFEKLYCYKLKKSGLLRKLNALNITNPQFLAKGKRGIVYKASYKKKPCVVKVNNTKSKVDCTIDKEAKWLSYVNKLGIGPKLYYSDGAVVVMEYIEGILILDYLNDSSKNIKRVILDLLDQMHLLDKKNIVKLEMTRPLKHIIVRKDMPILLDFERTRFSETPANVTQFLQFLSSGRFSLNLDKNKIIKLGRSYKENYNLKDIKDYLIKTFK